MHTGIGLRKRVDEVWYAKCLELGCQTTWSQATIISMLAKAIRGAGENVQRLDLSTHPVKLGPDCRANLHFKRPLGRRWCSASERIPDQASGHDGPQSRVQTSPIDWERAETRSPKPPKVFRGQPAIGKPALGRYDRVFPELTEENAEALVDAPAWLHARRK